MFEEESEKKRSVGALTQIDMAMYVHVSWRRLWVNSQRQGQEKVGSAVNVKSTVETLKADEIYEPCKRLFGITRRDKQPVLESTIIISTIEGHPKIP